MLAKIPVSQDMVSMKRKRTRYISRCYIGFQNKIQKAEAHSDFHAVLLSVDSRRGIKKIVTSTGATEFKIKSDGSVKITHKNESDQPSFNGCSITHDELVEILSKLLGPQAVE